MNVARKLEGFVAQMGEYNAALKRHGSLTIWFDPKMTWEVPSVMAQVAKLRARVHETFGKVALAMVALPRYRHLSSAELAPVLLEPLIRDRVALASKGDADDADALAGVVIWASVSDEVDAKIREQIKAGVFPVRLAAAD